MLVAAVLQGEATHSLIHLPSIPPTCCQLPAQAITLGFTKKPALTYELGALMVHAAHRHTALLH